MARARNHVRLAVGEAEAAMRDAAAPLDVGRLDHDQIGARVGEHGKMAEVPIGGGPVVGAVLAHGRDDDAIVEFKSGKLDR
jgi:hypothetical protein